MGPEPPGRLPRWGIRAGGLHPARPSCQTRIRNPTESPQAEKGALSAAQPPREPGGTVALRNNQLVSQRSGHPAAWWSKRRLSLGRIRGLSGRLVQNASESARNRLDLAKTAKLRRIFDHPRADPSERGVTQTHFGPQPTPGSADTNRSSSSRRNAAQHHRRAPVRAEHRPERARPHDLRSRPVAWCSGCAVPSGGVMR